MPTRRFVSTRMLAILCTCIAPSVLGSHGEAASYYEVIDLGTLGGTFCNGFFGQSSMARALNENAEAAGNSCVFVGSFQRVDHAFSWSGGVMTDLGTLGSEIPGTFDNSFAQGINDNGQIVGWNYLFSQTEPTAFLWSSGTMTSLSAALGGGFNSASDINNAGQIVGSRGTAPNIDRWSAYLYDSVADQVTTLPGLGGTFRISAVAINESGAVAGHSSTLDDNVFRAVKWTNNVPADLGTLGGTHSFATAINNAGDVVGHSWMPGDAGDHAFLFTNGNMQDLGTLGGPQSSANAINDAGEVVGNSSPAGGGSHAFIYEDGAMADLNERISPRSGWVLLDATAINASGQIVGYGTFNGETHAYLLNPSSPPPDTEPPALTVPSDFVVDAPTAEGAVVFYTVTAADDVDHHPVVTCAPASGSLFPVGETTVSCTATDNTGKSSSAAFVVTVRPPLEVVLSLDAKQALDKKSGVVTITGSVACNRDASFVSVSGQLTEQVTPRAVLQGSWFANVTCVAPTTSFSAPTQATSGRFGAGHAQLQASASAAAAPPATPTTRPRQCSSCPERPDRGQAVFNPLPASDPRPASARSRRQSAFDRLSSESRASEPVGA